MADLSDEQLAELRKVFGDGCDGVTIGQCVNVLHLLAEGERYRQPFLRSALSTAVHVLRTEGFRGEADQIASLLDHK